MASKLHCRDCKHPHIYDIAFNLNFYKWFKEVEVCLELSIENRNMHGCCPGRQLCTVKMAMLAIETVLEAYKWSAVTGGMPGGETYYY